MDNMRAHEANIEHLLDLGDDNDVTTFTAEANASPSHQSPMAPSLSPEEFAALLDNVDQVRHSAIRTSDFWISVSGS